MESGFAHLRQAVALDDNLPYDEPWGWMQPARHALGALLLEQGRVEAALAEYRADLGFDSVLKRSSQHPDNVWSLSGYHECLERTGPARMAAVAQQRLALARARADVPVQASVSVGLRVQAEGGREYEPLGLPTLRFSLRFPRTPGRARRSANYSASASHRKSKGIGS